MKIIHVVLSSGADYTDNYGYQENTLPEEHVRLGHDVTVVTSTFSSLVGSEREKTEGQYEINGVKIIRLNPSKTIASNRIALFPKLYDVLVDEMPDLLFVHGFLMPSLREIKKYKNKNSHLIVFYDAHNTYVNSMKRFPLLNKYILHKGLWRLIYQRNKSIFSKGYYTAPQVKQFLKEMYGVKENTLSFLPMGVYIPEEVYNNRLSIRNEYRGGIGVDNSTKLLVVGGRLREDKRILETIQAVNLLKGEKIKLLVFGTFTSEEYEKQVKNIADESVIFVGWQDNKSMQNIYFAADLGLFTGTQSVIWRAAVGCGLPSIIRYTDGAEELDLGGNCKFLYTDDPKAWAKEIRLLLHNDEELEKMTKIAETKGADFYSEKRIAQRIIDDYNSFLS